jgi:hypothetical protein
LTPLAPEDRVVLVAEDLVQASLDPLVGQEQAQAQVERGGFLTVAQEAHELPLADVVSGRHIAARMVVAQQHPGQGDEQNDADPEAAEGSLEGALVVRGEIEQKSADECDDRGDDLPRHGLVHADPPLPLVVNAVATIFTLPLVLAPIGAGGHVGLLGAW